MVHLTLQEAFDEMVLTMQAARRSADTITDYKNTYRKFGAFCGLDTDVQKITSKTIKEFLAMLASTPVTPAGVAKRPKRFLSGKSLQNHYVGLSALWTMLVRDGYVTDHIVRAVEKPKATKKLRETLTKDEMIALQAAAVSNRAWSSRPTTTTKRATAVRDDALVAVLLDCGVRNDELVNILLTDVDLKNHLILLRHTKGDKERKVTFGNTTRKKLLKWIKSRDDDQQWLFTTMNRPVTKLTNDTLGRLILRIGQRAGIKKRVTPHLLRHTCLTMRAIAGMDVYELKAFAGHEEIQTTLHYIELARLIANRESSKRFSPVDTL